MEAERFLLKWNNHQSNLVTVFDQLFEQEAFTDVTLACDGKSFAAHKVILSACSPYFQSLFLANPNTHPIVFMRDVKAPDLESLLAFMYRGEINVHQQDLASFLKTAESLQIKGLSDSSERQRDTSKILEAMEKKFNNFQNNNNNNNNNISTSCSNKDNTASNTPSSTSSQPSSTTPLSSPNNTSASMLGSSAAGAFALGNLPRVSSVVSSLNSLRLGASLNGGLTGAYGSLGATLPVLGAGNGYPENLSTSNATSSENRSPPAKRHRSLEDLPRILPKVRGALTSHSSFMNNIPGLLTPISLAAAAVNSVVTVPQMPILANTPTSVHASPPTPETSNSSLATDAITPHKEKIKREGLSETQQETNEHKDKNGHAESNYLSNADSPHHPLYMGSSIGSGSSTPSLDNVKEEEGDHLDDSTCLSDEPNNPADYNHMDGNVSGMYSDDTLTNNRERLSYPCRYCGKRFTQTGTCRRHERLHTSPNGFKCPFCQKGFNRKYRLKEHIISSHPSTAEEGDLTMIVNAAAANSLA